MIAVCSKCHRNCSYYSEEREDDVGWVIIKYSDCCDSEVIFYDNIKEVMLDRLI